jgi:FkbM family methyltransferase
MDKNNKQWKYIKALEYEIFTKEEYGFAKDKIKNTECIFDIWWHIWYFSQRCRSLNSNAKIHYFEPVGELYNQAKINLWNDKNIIFNNYWISSKTENWTILLNQEKTMQSSKYSSFLNPKWSEIGVNFISLKDYLEQRNIEKIDILKMDIEWMEFEVLNSRWEFERWKINNLIAEIHLLNESMKSERNKIFPDIKKRFWNIEIINSGYRNEIFLIRACKNSK